MSSFRPSLTVSIMAFLGCLLLLTWLLFSLLAFKTATNDLYAQKGEHARTLLTTFVSLLPESLPTYPEGIISTASPSAIYVQKLSEDSVFTRLTLLDQNNKVILTAGSGTQNTYLPFEGVPLNGEGSFVQQGEDGVACVVPVVRNGIKSGKAGIVLSLASEKTRLSRSRQLLVLYFVIDFILLFSFGSFILSRIIVIPINRLLAATEKITWGHYGQRVGITGSSEMAQLSESFNLMSTTLMQKEQEVANHVAALENANHELQQAREESIRTEKMASIGLLAAGMAHEIGTPLASIMGFAELLQSEQVGSDSIHDYAQRIISDGTRIDRIVRGLLDYSRQRMLTSETANIAQLVVETIELLLHQGALKQIEVTTHIEDGLPLAQADPYQLQQVLVNLMLNSRDAMPSGGVLIIRGALDSTEPVGKSGAAASVRIDVIDSGTGVDSELVKHIFDPFFTTKPPGKGTGLGLAISARIIEGFGGWIESRNNEDRGACFSVWLPVATVIEGVR